MSLNTAGDIVYQKALVAGGIRFQTDPPVCNRCTREITRKNFGWAYLERQERTPGQCEIIECTAGTMIRAGGEPLGTFVLRYNL